jgi:hypothetical protein
MHGHSSIKYAYIYQDSYCLSVHLSIKNAPQCSICIYKQHKWTSRHKKWCHISREFCLETSRSEPQISQHFASKCQQKPKLWPHTVMFYACGVNFMTVLGIFNDSISSQDDMGLGLQKSNSNSVPRNPVVPREQLLYNEFGKCKILHFVDLASCNDSW